MQAHQYSTRTTSALNMNLISTQHEPHQHSSWNHKVNYTFSKPADYMCTV